MLAAEKIQGSLVVRKQLLWEKLKIRTLQKYRFLSQKEGKKFFLGHSRVFLLDFVVVVVERISSVIYMMAGMSTLTDSLACQTLYLIATGPMPMLTGPGAPVLTGSGTPMQTGSGMPILTGSGMPILAGPWMPMLTGPGMPILADSRMSVLTPDLQGIKHSMQQLLV